MYIGSHGETSKAFTHLKNTVSMISSFILVWLLAFLCSCKICLFMKRIVLHKGEWIALLLGTELEKFVELLLIVNVYNGT